MAIFDFMKKKVSNINLNDQSVKLDDVLLSALINGETITRDKALTLPVVADAVDLICSIIASTPIKLYKYKQGKVSEVEGDTRTKLLNGDTGDTLNGNQLKYAMVEDYLLGKGGYAVIERLRNNVTGLYYVKDDYVSILQNTDPIHKYNLFQIGTKQFKSFEILKLLRKTKNGASGKGVTDEISKALETAYSTLIYQLGLVKSGGNKKGFLKSQRKLGQEEIDLLKRAWRNLYTNNEDNVVVLNNGLEFQESSNSSVEMQLNESKKALEDEIKSVFHIRSDFYQTFKEAIYPIIKAFETELNSVLLLENEKRYMFFEFDVKEILRANIKERYEAYGKALKDGWKTINEVRKEENMNAIEGMDVLSLGLGDVLYDVKDGVYYTPNTGQMKSNKDNSVPEESSQDTTNQDNSDNQDSTEDKAMKGGDE